MPSKVFDLELSEELKPIWGMERYDGACILVRYYGKPIGWLYINGLRQSVLSAERLRENIDEQLGWELIPVVLEKQISASVTTNASLPPISVVVCTRNWSSRHTYCLENLLSLDYPNYEIIIVDNSPGSEDNARLAMQLPVRYVREKESGLAYARNRGIAEARYDIIAFTADSARPDRYWLRAIACAFAESEVMAVVGLVAPTELETMSQFRFEFDYGMARSLRRWTCRRSGLTDRKLLYAHNFGTDSNMAFRRQLFNEIGPFNMALDSGAFSNGGDEIFHRLIAQGYTLVYEPAALVWYTYRRDATALRRWVYDKGSSFGAYLMTCMRNHTVSRLSILRFFTCGWMGTLFRKLLRPGKLPRHLIAIELMGALSSPLAYRKGLSNAKRILSTTEPCKLPRMQLKEFNKRLLSVRSVPWEEEYRICRAANRNSSATHIRVIRTWYPHWGVYAGINQFLRYIDWNKYDIDLQIVQENDNDFPIKNKIVRDLLRFMVQRQNTPWYNLSDLMVELKTLRYYLYKKVDIVHFLDGEHSAQFLPRLCILPRKVRPKLVVSYHQPTEVLDKVIRKDNIPRVDCIIVVSPEQRDFFSALTAPEKVRLILHGIDIDHFKPVTKLNREGKFKCISVGHNYRDYKTVREVATKLIHDRNIEFHVVSPRPTGLGGLSNVRVYKDIDDAQLLNLYQQSDILFLPLLQATANNALLEGAACGLPVLSTSLPAVKAYLPGNEAILVEDNDPQQFADAILRLARNPDICNTMAIEARKRAEELDWRNIAPQYEVIYSNLMGNR